MVVALSCIGKVAHTQSWNPERKNRWEFMSCNFTSPANSATHFVPPETSVCLTSNMQWLASSSLWFCNLREDLQKLEASKAHQLQPNGDLQAAKTHKLLPRWLLTIRTKIKKDGEKTCFSGSVCCRIKAPLNPGHECCVLNWGGWL